MLAGAVGECAAVLEEGAAGKVEAVADSFLGGSGGVARKLKEGVVLEAID